VSAGLGATLMTSILLHVLGLTALSMVGGSLWSPPPPSNLITTELLVAPPPPAVPAPVLPPEPEPLPPTPVEPPEALPVPPPPAPEPQPITPPKMEPITPPKLVEKPMPERVKIPPPVSRARPKAPPSPPLRAAAAPEPAQAGSPPPLPAEAKAPAGGNVLGAPAERPPDAAPAQPVEGGEAGAGKLFDRGDVGVVPGAGAGAGSGGPGRAGLGTGGAGASGGARVAGLPPGTGNGSGLARPLGGYQVKPRYPESARRQGVEGTTLLKIYVTDRGLVEDVLIEHSAGHHDLDFAAMEAVKRWRFEPARQGNRAVAVWVMLPVRFTLK
jgi:TonB family protein